MRHRLAVLSCWLLLCTAGKTLGFVIPVVEFLVQNNAAARAPRARLPLCIVLTPTRELALQVEGEFEKIGRHLGLRSVCVYGGASPFPQVCFADQSTT